MALSVLTIIPTQRWGLYCSETKSYLATGSEGECYDYKHELEGDEQAEANRRYLEELRAQRLAELQTAGLSGAEARAALKVLQPGL